PTNRGGAGTTAAARGGGTAPGAVGTVGGGASALPGTAPAPLSTAGAGHACPPALDLERGAHPRRPGPGGGRCRPVAGGPRAAGAAPAALLPPLGPMAGADRCRYACAAVYSLKRRFSALLLAVPCRAEPFTPGRLQ